VLGAIKMKQLLFVTVFVALNTFLKAQDTPSIYKVHFISAEDLRYETSRELKGVFVLGKEANQKQIHFSDSLKFEKQIYFGIDSLVTIPGKYSYNPGGWLVLRHINGELEKYALIRFYKFMFLVRDMDQEKFESEFEMMAGKFRYTALKAFVPDAKLLEVCRAFSDRYFVMQIN
jgi:hypothetical protein